MIPDEQYTLIERYVQGQLSEAELATFDQLLRENPDFAHELQIQRDIAQAGESADALAFEALVREVEKERKSGQRPTRKISLISQPWLSIAAAVVLLIIGYLIWNIFGNPESLSPEQLYAEHVDLSGQSQLLGYQQRQDRGGQLPEGDSSKIREILLIRDRLQEVDILYQQARYQEAAQILDSLLQSANPEHFSQSDVSYNLGLIEMYLEEWEDAIEHFSQVIGDPKPKAEWYSAMAYLRLDDLPKARQLLETIAQDDLHPKQEAAGLVLRHL